MLAVFQLSGYQYSASEGETIRVPRQETPAGGKLNITEVLLVKDNDRALVGRPFIEAAAVEAEIVGTGKTDKVLVYKYKRRTKYRRRYGHRQDYTDLKITRIVAPQS